MSESNIKKKPWVVGQRRLVGRQMRERRLDGGARSERNSGSVRRRRRGDGGGGSRRRTRRRFAGLRGWATGTFWASATHLLDTQLSLLERCWERLSRSREQWLRVYSFLLLLTEAIRDYKGFIFIFLFFISYSFLFLKAILRLYFFTYESTIHHFLSFFLLLLGLEYFHSPCRLFLILFYLGLFLSRFVSGRPIYT